MNAMLAESAFAVYRALGAAAAPIVRRHLRRRCARGREDPVRLEERLGRTGATRPPGPLAWVHGASVGESLSALPLIERIREERPGLAVLVTTGTVTSARLMAERLPAGVVHQYVPVDLPGPVARFLDHWRPSLGLILESEFWPNLLRAAHARGVELVLVNGRMSARSYRSWRRVRPLIEHVLGLFSMTLAQSREDLAHFRALGARDARRAGNLKFAAAPLAADPDELATLRTALRGRPRWLAASVHPGEDTAVAAAHAALAAAHPGLLTLLAPRHPQRGPEMAERLRAAGLRVARRGANEAITSKIDAYVADTIGEMGLWYRLAEVVFVGGSLVPHGGQNLLEPAKLDCAILCGPHMTNFVRVTDEMKTAGAAREVADAPALGAAIDELLGDDAARAAMIEAARDYSAAEASVLDAVMEALTPYLDAAEGRSCADAG